MSSKNSARGHWSHIRVGVCQSGLPGRHLNVFHELAAQILQSVAFVDNDIIPLIMLHERTNSNNGSIRSDNHWEIGGIDFVSVQ